MIKIETKHKSEEQTNTRVEVKVKDRFQFLTEMGATLENGIKVCMETLEMSKEEMLETLKNMVDDILKNNKKGKGNKNGKRNR